MNETDEARCQYEGENCYGEVRKVIDPYDAEIYGEERETVLCDGHFQQLSDDI